MAGAVPLSLSFDIEPGFTQRLHQLILDLAADLVHDVIPDVLKNTDLAVHRTDHGGFGFRIAAGTIDLKLRAALRAKGFKLNADRFVHSSSPVDASDTSTVEPMGAGVKPASGGAQ